jgi:hypothetical protein
MSHLAALLVRLVIPLAVVHRMVPPTVGAKKKKSEDDSRVQNLQQAVPHLICFKLSVLTAMLHVEKIPLPIC